MLHLAIECSGIVGSVALYDDSLPIRQLALPTAHSSIQTLAPALKQLLANLPDRPKFLSVTTGPGSFTSLRVGIATAKMLAMAWDIPAVGIDSLAATAHRTAVRNRPLPHSEFVVVPIINAYRKQLFAAAWKFSSHGFENVAQSQVVGTAEWHRQPLESLHFIPSPPETLHSHPPHAIVTGPGLAGCALESLPAQIAIAEEAHWQPQAADVAELGWLAFQNGHANSASELIPNYVRASAAEDKLLNP